MDSKDVTFQPLTIQMQLRNMLGWKTIQKQLDLIRLDTVNEALKYRLWEYMVNGGDQIMNEMYCKQWNMETQTWETTQ